MRSRSAKKRRDRAIIDEERRRQDGEVGELATRAVLRLFADGRLVYRERVHVHVWDVGSRIARLATVRRWGRYGYSTLAKRAMR